MSQLAKFIEEREDQFACLNTGNTNKLNFEQEKSFAVQQLCKNDYTLSVARDNKNSLVQAIDNLASIGLSLNPALNWAYLVPRDGLNLFGYQL